jgi:hypothetical protein
MCDERGLPELGVPAGHVTANREYEDKRARIRHPRAQSHPNLYLFRAHLADARAFATIRAEPGCRRAYRRPPRAARHPDSPLLPPPPANARAFAIRAHNRTLTLTLTFTFTCFPLT